MMWNAERAAIADTDLLLEVLADREELLDEADDWRRPFDPSEWGGRSRQEAAQELYEEVLHILLELQRRGVSPPAR